MKKILSVILAAAMLLSALAMTAAAAPSGQCLKLDENGLYALFENFSFSANDTKVSFDISMGPDSGGENSKVAMNGNVTITPTAFTAGSTTKSISWGTNEVTHWRHLDITYSNGTVSVSLDGEVIVSGEGTMPTGNIYFVGWPGVSYIDNLCVISAGNTICDMNFDDEGYYLQHKSSDATALRASVPDGSYYDYSPVILPDNVEYIFNNVVNCNKLTVSSGETYVQGDINADGEITVKDSKLLMKLLLGLENQEDYPRADINGDGEVSVKDSKQFMKYLLGIEEPQEVSTGAAASAECDTTMQSAKLSVGSTVTDGIDAQLTMDAIEPADYNYAVITYMTPNSSEQANSSAAAEAGFGAWGNFETFTLVNDGKFHSQIVDLSGMTTWNGDAATLRFFVAANEGDVMYVDSIIFCPNLSRANAVASARETAKAGFSITDEPVFDPNGAIGSYDANGNYVIRFDSEEKVAAKVSNGNNSSVSFADSALKATATNGADPSVYLDLTAENINASNFSYIGYVCKVPVENGRDGPSANMYYVCGDISIPTGGYETDLQSLAKNSKYASYVYDLSAKTNFSGTMKGIRIDYFSDCSTGDVCYIDTIIFGSTQANVSKAANSRVQDRNPVVVETPQEVWNQYRGYYLNANNNEFITSYNGDFAMYFRYNTDSSKFTARSLGDRMARAISEATGYEVTCEVYSGFIDLKSNFSSSEPANYIYYTITYNNKSYVVRLYTVIMKDSGYTDALDGTSADPELSYGNTSTWFSDGISATDSATFTTSYSGLMGHSCHEVRVVDTPYGTFSVLPSSSDDNTWGTIGGAEMTIYRIYDDGTSKALATYSFAHHTSKPNIFYAADGMVYVVQCDDQGSNCSILVAYFDPSKPKSDGSYGIVQTRTSIGYNGGSAPGGYGYIQPVLDDTNGKIYIFACGGSTDGYFAWFIYNYKTHSFESTSYSTILNTNRHCYLYGYSDGKNGVYIVGGRDVLLSTLGLSGIVYGADYAWDEVNIFHFPDIHSTRYTRYTVTEADYTQTDRSLFPVTANNSHGDAFLSSDGYLHVITSTAYHGNFHHDTKYWQMDYAVYNVAGAGAAPQLVHHKPIGFVNPSNKYFTRMTESTSGKVYILSMPDGINRCEIWCESDSNPYEYELVGCKNLSGNSACNSLMIGNSRNGSVVDDTVSVIYPTDSSSGHPVKFFTVNIK